jgi:mannosyl-3-phosphoglycerate phosphatase
MTMRFRKPGHPLVVYTDLDGTLLDHDTYSPDDAVPALERLAALAVPVIPVSSKTLDELAVLGAELGLDGPCIAENGGMIAIPTGYFEPDPPLATCDNYLVEYLSPDYTDILATLGDLRREHGLHFAGFADMSDEEVAHLTGLSLEDAQRARRRRCSEPIQWRDTAETFAQFSQELEKRGLRLVRGGRFHHVLGASDKAHAIDRLNHYYQQAGFSGFHTIALGDSPNDIRMLQEADIAVVIRRKDGSWLTLETTGEKVQTRASGPRGWNEFFQQYLDAAAEHAGLQRTTHG